MEFIFTIGHGAINSGVTKYGAEYHENEEKQNGVIKASFFIAFICFIILGSSYFYYLLAYFTY